MPLTAYTGSHCNFPKPTFKEPVHRNNTAEGKRADRAGCVYQRLNRLRYKTGG